jgi:Homeodomain-like domain
MSLSHKHVVRLTGEQRTRLLDLTRTGSAPARKLSHARVLLLADADHPEGQRPDSYIARALGMHENAVARIRKRFVLQGEQPALDRKPRATPPVPPKIDGRVEAHLVAICCSTAPAGRTRWTLQLLADELARRKLVTSVSIETVRQVLKKTNSSRGASSAGASGNGSRRGS